MAGNIRRVARIGAFVIIATVAAMGCAIAGFAFVVVRQAARELPTPVALRAERLVQDTIVVDRHGRRIAALRAGDAHREVVPYDRISPHLRAAAVAAEDERFWTHRGLDPYGIARAFLRNLANGQRLQGGSTITQQLLKLTMLQGRPVLLRKVEEMMLAEHFERLLSKEQLLALYLNAVYLGGGNAGVEAAARDLFGIPSAKVTLSQAALLVSAIPAPSTRSPFCEPAAARRQQRRVLDRLVATRLLTSAAADRAAAEPIQFRLADDGPSEAEIASALDLIEALHPTLAGERITLTIDLLLQRRALAALRATLEVFTRARGEHRGPRLVLPTGTPNRWIAELHTLRQALREWGTGSRGLLVYDLSELPSDRVPADPCRYGSTIFRRARSRGLASGVVIAHETDQAMLDLGDLRGTLSAASITWTGRSLETVAPVGAIVNVRLPKRLPTGPDTTVVVELIPRPVVEGAVVILDPRTREVLALVGGTEPRRGEYNRALYARRPIGSAVKPFVFAAALAAGTLSLDAELHDSPYRYVDPWSGEVWEPQNWHDEYLGPLTVNKAIARSVNMAAIEVAFTVGVDRVAAFFEEVSPVAAVVPDPAIALGAFERTPFELANAYATFADQGRVRPIVAVRREGSSPSFSPPPGEDEKVGEALVLNSQLVRTVDQLLREPIMHPEGTAHRLARLRLPICGKTGTSDDARDAWFVGYTPELLVAVWVGYDQPRRLITPRREESGGTLAVPVAEAIFAYAFAGRKASGGSFDEAPSDNPEGAWGPDASWTLRHAFADKEME